MNHIEEFRSPEVLPVSIMHEIRMRGFHAIANNPNIVNTLGNPNHHPGIFEQDTRVNGTIQTEGGDTFIDETGYWMTESIDSKWLEEDRLLMETLGRLTIEAPTVSEFATPEHAAFLSMMHEFWPDAAHIFCYNSGTDATDAAAKAMVAQVMIDQNLRPEDMKIVALDHAFHGRSGWGQELTARTKKTEDWQIGQAVRIPSPAMVFDDDGTVDGKETAQQMKTSFDALENAFQKSANVAGIMVEYPFPPEALEVADYVTFGKFFRVSGVMAKDPTKRGFKEDHMAKEEKYGATWAGRLADMVAAQAIVSIIERNNLWENGRNQANRMYLRLRELAIAKKGILRPRISGAYLGFDFATKDTRNAFVSKARDEHHVLFLAAGETAIRWAPRLDATEEQVDHVFDVIESMLSCY